MNELFTRILTQLDKVEQHIINLFASVYGYCIFCVSMISSFIVGEKIAITIVFIAILLDMFFGIITSIRNKSFATSHLAQDTFIKVAIYGAPLLLIGLASRLFGDWNIAFHAGCALAVGCELWSITAHLIILAPDKPFLKILRFQLKDEIKNKTGKDIEELTKKKEDDETN